MIQKPVRACFMFSSLLQKISEFSPPAAAVATVLACRSDAVISVRVAPPSRPVDGTGNLRFVIATVMFVETRGLGVDDEG